MEKCHKKWQFRGKKKSYKMWQTSEKSHKSVKKSDAKSQTSVKMSQTGELKKSHNIA